jgi:hypothetical protein
MTAGDPDPERRSPDAGGRDASDPDASGPNAGGADAGGPDTSGPNAGGLNAGGRDARDPELREMFLALRRREAEAVPDFAEVRAATAGRRAARHAAAWPLRLAAVVAATVVAVALAVWLWRGGGVFAPGIHLGPSPSRAHTTAPAPFTVAAASITTWRPATDFLLRTLGRELLTATPAFGRQPALGLALDETSRAHRPTMNPPNHER